jgi:methionyl-tRNA formyltransferase
MSSALILLTGHREAPYLIDYIRGYSTTLPIIHANDLEDLERECLPGRVLIAFCTAVIVPAALLDRLDRPAFNFHPGPPTYPGRHPESFAAYDGVIRFGATAHVMVPRVDEGPIVGVEWFDVPPETGQMMLADLAFQATLRLFAKLAPIMALSAQPLKPIDERWSGRKTSRRDYDRMTDLPLNIDAVEFDRRLRSFGEDPETRITVTLHGRRFILEQEV